MQFEWSASVKPKTSFSIGNRDVGRGNEPFIVAELSGNHCGSLMHALELIDIAASIGADAVKIQTYTADTITLDSDREEFMIEEGIWAGTKLHDLYSQAYTPWEWHKALFDRAEMHDLVMFSSPFDTSAVDFLEDLGCPAYKIASFELTDLYLIEYVASKGKPIIMSTGLATFEEIAEAVDTVLSSGNCQLALLHCVSGYPTPIEDSNLRTLLDLKKRFKVVVGLSDHSLTTTTGTVSVALGGSIIEKHLVKSRKSNAIDKDFSLEPNEFKILIQNCKSAFRSLGSVGYDLKKSEVGGRHFRRSLYASQFIAKGEEFTNENVKSVRPAMGLSTKYFNKVLLQRATEDIQFGTPLAQHHLSDGLE
jgi:N-acetylneuraminate synthase